MIEILDIEESNNSYEITYKYNDLVLSKVIYAPNVEIAKKRLLDSLK